jgi:hypothetical protein
MHLASIDIFELGALVSLKRCIVRTGGIGCTTSPHRHVGKASERSFTGYGLLD